VISGVRTVMSYIIYCNFLINMVKLSSAQSRLSPKLIPKWIKRDLKIFSFFSVIIRLNLKI